MIKITTLTMKNFLSVGAVTIALDLAKDGLTLVLGANSDTNGGLTRNGAGKTSIAQAISFAIYGKPLSRIKIPNLINNVNNKQMLVSLEFERDGVKYRIERGRKPDVMKFYVNNDEVKEDDEVGFQQGENRHTQEEIERIIGMSHTMFRNIVILNSMTEPFLRMPVAQQREVIEELLGVTQISQRAEVLKKLIGQTKENMRDEQARIKAIIEANTRIEAAMNNAQVLSDTWSRAHEAKLSELSETVSAMQSIDYPAEIAKFDEDDKLFAKEREIRLAMNEAVRETTHLSREIANFESEAKRFLKDAHTDIAPQIKRLNQEINRKLSDNTRRTDQIKVDETELEKLQFQIANPNDQICVCCNQTLSGTDHLETVLKNLKGSATKLTKKIATEKAAVQEGLLEIENIETEIKQVTETANIRKQDFEAKAAEKQANADGLKDKLEELQEIVAKHKQDIVSLPTRPTLLFTSRDELYTTKQQFDALLKELEVENALVNPHETQVESFRQTLQEVSYDYMNDLDSLFKHQDFLMRLLTNKDSFIRKKIIDQNLNYLNSRMNHYLDKLGLPHEVKFMSDLNVEIMLLGRDFDFEQLSRGEMNRVIIATSLSFRDVWESLNSSMNLVFLDEVLDNGTDAQGVEAALAILKSLARDRAKNVFLISHRDDLTARIDRILLVRKENGFTRFEEDVLV